MAGEEGIPVAQLFAALGLDASSLEAGLATSKVSLAQFEDALSRMERGVFQKLQAPFYAAAAAAKALGGDLDAVSAKLEAYNNKLEGQRRFQLNKEADDKRVLASQKALYEAQIAGPRGLESTGTQDLVDKLMANAELQRSRIQARALEMESNLAEKEMAEQRKIIHQMDIAAEKEYAALKDQIGAEEAAATKARIAEEEAAFKYQMERMRERLASTKIEQREELYIYRQQAEARRAESFTTPGGVGPLGFRGTAVEVQAGLNLIGIAIPRGLTSVLARLPSVQQAMGAAFSAFALLAFYEILGQVSDKIRGIYDDWIGFGEASKKAWQAAQDGAISSRMELIRYKEELIRVSGAGLKPEARGGTKYATEEEQAKEALKEVQRQIKGATDEQRSIEYSLDLLRSSKGQAGGAAGPGAFRAGTPEEVAKNEAARALSFQYGTLEDMEKRLKAIVDREDPSKGELPTLLKEQGRIQLRIMDIHKRALEENTTAIKKQHDNLQELPNRLPWFFGPNQAFVNSQRSGQIVADSFRPSPPSGVPGSTPVRPLAAAGSTTSGTSTSGGITVYITSSPTFQFDGVPADIQSFMRDHAEPELLKDLRINARGVTEDLVKTLKSNGVYVQ